MLPLQSISFTSTYRIPFTERGMTPSKKVMLQNFAKQYENHLYPHNRLGYARISVPKELDNEIENGLKNMHVRVYQKFSEHDVPVKKMNEVIKQALYNGTYQQVGKQKPRTKNRYWEKRAEFKKAE